MCNNSRRLSFENQNFMKTEKGQHEKLIIGIPISHRRWWFFFFQRWTSFVLPEGELLLEKAFTRDRKFAIWNWKLQKDVHSFVVNLKMLMYPLKALDEFVLNLSESGQVSKWHWSLGSCSERILFFLCIDTYPSPTPSYANLQRTPDLSTDVWNESMWEAPEVLLFLFHGMLGSSKVA